MATSIEPVIISPKNKSQARRIVQELRCEKLLSLDSEGVQLGKDGPLTLLQIGTLDGRVYLFDVMLNERKQDKSFFKDTGLESILTSNEIVKVIHSCSGDSAALFHQFGIHLQKVFDTQVAHLVIEEDKGRKLPSRLKLAEICAHYSENAEVYEDKDKLKMQWSKLVGNFWAIRPMTDEMIQYASCDVTALIPEVYDTQKKYIMDKGLYETYQDRVKEEIELVIDPEQKERRNKRNQDNRVAILTGMDKKCPDSVQFVSVTDPDEKKAIEDTRPGEMDAFSGKMKRLKQESMITCMEEIEQELLTPECFNPHKSIWYKLGEVERHGTETAMQKASGLKERLSDMILQDIETKYAPDTSLECLNSLDCQVLKTVRPIANQGQAYSKTILNLHWRLVEKDLDDETEKTKDDAAYEVRISFGKLKFFISNDKVPIAIKAKATALKDFAEKRVLQSIPQKYTESTGIEDLSVNERAVLGTLQVGRIRYHRVVVALHWKVTYEKLCEDLQEILAGKLRMNDGFKRKLNFLKSNSSVPRNVKEKAMEILSRTSSGRR